MGTDHGSVAIVTDLRLPLGRLTAGLAAAGVIGAFAIQDVAGVPPPLEAVLVVAATLPLLLVGRYPLLGLAAVLAALIVVRELEVTAGLPWGSLLVTVAAFVAGVSADPRRAPWLVPLGAVYVAHRLRQPYPDVATVVLTAARFGGAAGGGVLIRRRLERVRALVAEGAALRRAVEAGPAEAIAAEQLRVWSAVQPRTDRVVAELPGHAALAAQALRGDPAEAVRHLEAIRALALEAFEEMRATVGALVPSPDGGGDVPAERRLTAVLDASLAPPRAGDGVLLAQEVAASLERFMGILGRREHDARDLRARVRGERLRLTVRLGRGAIGEEDRAALWLLAGRVRLQGGRLDIRRRPDGTRIELALPAGRAGEPGGGAEAGRWRWRPPSPLAAVCALLVAGALIEQAMFGDLLPGPAALGWAIAASLGWVPLLAPRFAVPAALLCAALVLAGSAADVLGGPTSTQNFVAILIAAIAAAAAPLRRAVLALLVVDTGMLLGLWVEPSPWLPFDYVMLGLTVAGAWGAGYVLRGVARALEQAREESLEAGAALADLERRAVLGERVRLAGELHDLVGHALTAIVVQAAAASAQAQRGRPQAAASIATLAGAADLAVSELRRLARVLEVPDDARVGGVAASPSAELRAIAARARRTGQAVALELEGPVDDLDYDVALAAQRIVQEALTNAAKHAAGAPVDVSLRAVPGGAALRVVNGPGRPEGVGEGGGHGLRSMAERARGCGGELEAGPVAGGGWEVVARLGEADGLRRSSAAGERSRR